MRQDLEQRKNEILKWINSHESKAFICKQFQCRPQTLDSFLQRNKITYKGNQSLKGKKQSATRLTAIELSKQNWVGSHLLKSRILEDGIKEHKCEKCKNTEWNNQKVPLELHHIDGNRFNNKFNNLQLLCPNCHAQTSNYCRKHGLVV